MPRTKADGRRSRSILIQSTGSSADEAATGPIRANDRFYADMLLICVRNFRPVRPISRASARQAQLHQSR